MRPITGTNPNWQATAANAAWRARALEKPSNTADLKGEEREPEAPPPRQKRKTDAPHLRQSGTEEAVPFRHASPRLTAPFTTQLLGQILPDPERRASTGYSTEPVRLALGLDTRL